MPIIVGGIMARFINAANCVPNWLPLDLPCNIITFLIWAVLTALILDIVVYSYPRQIKPILIQTKREGWRPDFLYRPKIKYWLEDKDNQISLCIKSSHRNEWAKLSLNVLSVISSEMDKSTIFLIETAFVNNHKRTIF